MFTLNLEHTKYVLELTEFINAFYQVMSQGLEKKLELDGASTIETLVAKVNEKTQLATEHLDTCDELLFQRMENVEMEAAKDAARALAPHIMEVNTLLAEMTALLKTKNRALKNAEKQQQPTEAKDKSEKKEKKNAKDKQ